MIDFSALTALQPALPGPAAGCADALLVQAWKTGRERHRLGFTDRFLAYYDRNPIRTATLFAHAKALGMDRAALTAPSGRRFVLFTGPGRDLAIAERLGSIGARLFPDTLRLPVPIAALDGTHLAAVGADLDRLWDARLAGPELALRGAGRLDHTGPIPAWLPDVCVQWSHLYDPLHRLAWRLKHRLQAEPGVGDLLGQHRLDLHIEMPQPLRHADGSTRPGPLLLSLHTPTGKVCLDPHTPLMREATAQALRIPGIIHPASRKADDRGPMVLDYDAAQDRYTQPLAPPISHTMPLYACPPTPSRHAALEARARWAQALSETP